MTYNAQRLRRNAADIIKVCSLCKGEASRRVYWTRVMPNYKVLLNHVYLCSIEYRDGMIPGDETTGESIPAKSSDHV